MKNYQFLQQKYSVNTYPDRGITLTRGEGVYLYDHAGDRYLDMMSNYGVSLFGYGHPGIQANLSGQLGRLTTLHGSFNNDVRGEAVRALVKRCGGGLEKVYFCNSGAEAVEAALKFAVLATGKKKFVSCRGGYHGKTLGALSSSHEEKYTSPFRPLLWDFKPVKFNNIADLEHSLDDETAAFLVEPIQGEGGVNVPDAGYLMEAEGICEERGVFLILDEVQTGAGRTGSFLASEKEISGYDVLCLGKGLAAGIPVGATLVSGKVAGRIPKSIHTSTFGGNPLTAAGILAVLELLDEKLLAHVREIGGYFQTRLEELSGELIVQTRGKGLMLGVEVSGRRNEILQRLQKAKILAIPAADNMVRFLPPYIIEKQHVDSAVDALDRILKEIEIKRVARQM